MKTALQFWAVCAVLLVPAFAFAQSQADSGADLRAEAEQLFALANQARSNAGLGQLQWDPALARAALFHCRWMVREGPIAHRYDGELDLQQRAANSGARFGTIEENVAIGSTPAVIHQAWMNSPGHRANLLSPEVDRVGIAVIASRGVLYAVQDFSRGVPSLTADEVEAKVADLVRVSGIGIEDDHAVARAACAMNAGFPRNAAGVEPRFIDRWQDPTLEKLPQQLVDKLSSGNYRSAAIGSCPAPQVQGGFTSYRVAVLLY